ncbi:MAG: Crp/Fnr family transcriptional regulator [Bacteroidota bacterium]|nr:Crp/Fnr family transcriptional regulator [Bacteroidota bacterium]
MISESSLKKYSATTVKLEKGETIFHYGDAAVFFYIVHHGKIKMTNYSDDGREFVQGYFTDGQSFGEPPFFQKSPYPASAIAVEKSTVWKIPRENFLKLLKNNFDIHLELTTTLSNRLIYKSTMLSELAIEEAEHRLVTLMQFVIDHNKKESLHPYKIPFTRQQLADMTGLRVETVIRTMKSLEQKRFLEIDGDGKILWKSSSKSKPTSV